MMNDILIALGCALFIWIVYVGAVKVFTGEWLWVVWERNRKKEKDLKLWLKDKE